MPTCSLVALSSAPASPRSAAARSSTSARLASTPCCSACRRCRRSTATASHRARAGIRRRCAAEAAPTRSNRRSAPEPARDAVAVVARPGADQRDLVHLRYAEQAQRVPVRDEGFDVVAPFKELQLPAPVRLPAATQVDDVGERAVLVLRTVVVHVEEVALAIARGHRADHADAAIAGELVGEFDELRAVEEIEYHVLAHARVAPVAQRPDHAVAGGHELDACTTPRTGRTQTTVDLAVGGKGTAKP